MLYSALGQEDPLEKGVVTHSGILAWRILWTEEWPSPGVGGVGLEVGGSDWGQQ